MSYPSSSRCVVPHKCGINSRMPKGVGGGELGHARAPNGLLDRPLDHGLMQVVPAPLAGLAVYVGPGGGKDPLPGPLPPGIRVLAF